MERNSDIKGSNNSNGSNISDNDKDSVRNNDNNRKLKVT